MRHSTPNRKRVLSRAGTQIDAFQNQSDLETGMPCPLAQVQEAQTEVLDRHDEAGKAYAAWRTSVRGIEEAVRALYGALQANLAVAAMRHGRSSAELIRLGGNPRKNPGRAKAAPATDAPASEADATRLSA